MLLPVPIVGVDPGPDYATNVNNCFFFVDAHDHSPGKGLQITPSGMNINAALTFTNNPATNLKYANFTSQGAVSVLKSLYVVNNDLYFTDGNGNAFPITASGGVAGSPGSIGSLVAPASVTYNTSTQTFVFAATATQAANIDGATHIFRNTTSPFNGVTVSAPLALASSYNIVLPPLPTGTGNFVVLDSSGNLTAPYKLDFSTININGSNQIYSTAGTPDGVTIQNISGVTSVRNGDREHDWELNGAYGTLTSYPQTNIDAIFFAPYALTITGIWIYSSTNGTSGTTEFDLKYKTSPSGTFTSLFASGTTGKISATTALSIGAISTTGASSPYTVTVNTPTAHGFVAGDSVTIAGVTPTVYNGTWTVATVPLSTSFTFSITTTQGASTVGGTLATRTLVYTDSGSIVGAQIGVVKPALSTTAIPAGAVIRFDLIQAMNTGATDARIRMWYKQS